MKKKDKRKRETKARKEQEKITQRKKGKQERKEQERMIDVT